MLNLKVLQPILQNTLRATCDMCMFRLKAPNDKAMNHRKSILTTSRNVFSALDQRLCNGLHEHQTIEGRVKCSKTMKNIKLQKLAGNYAAKFAQTVAQAILKHPNEARHDIDQPNMLPDNRLRRTHDWHDA